VAVTHALLSTANNSLNFPFNKVSFANSRLQVIVKAAEIRLTPERPQYPGAIATSCLFVIKIEPSRQSSGGTRHIEGMKNEDIIATMIYYYDV
jgi:hypothetical protein